MDIIHFALAIFVAPAMMAIFLLLVRNDLKETFNNQDLKTQSDYEDKSKLRLKQKKNK